ncbi:MAG: hypothetical protein EBS23_02825 [Betaproteobacteria bacterium]|nr:hypothetical protein [Betaproteobacteria bacterium]
MTQSPRKTFQRLRDPAKRVASPETPAPRSMGSFDLSPQSQFKIKPPPHPRSKRDQQSHGPRLDAALRDARTFLRTLERRHKLTFDEAVQVMRALREEFDDPLYETQFEQDERERLSGLTEERPENKGSLELPAVPPALWKDRDLNRRENAPAFITRVYDRWLGKGLERRHLATLDPDLYRALSVWVVRHPDDPIVAQLPPQHELVDELIEQLSAEYPVDVLRKLGRAIDSRMRRKRAENVD